MTKNSDSNSQSRRGSPSKRVPLSTRGKVLIALALVASGASLPLLTRADQSKGNSGGEGHRLEGSWINTVSAIVPPGAPPRIAQTYVTFAAGGASIGSDRTKPFASPQHGTWV